MVATTRKFSDFTDGSTVRQGDEVVGLRSGDNTRFDFPGVGVADVTGNLMLAWNTIGALAVNYPSITNSATTNAVDYGVAGTDTNIDWQATAKGTGIFNFNATTALNIASGTTAQRPPTP